MNADRGVRDKERFTDMNKRGPGLCAGTLRSGNRQVDREIPVSLVRVDRFFLGRFCPITKIPEPSRDRTLRILHEFNVAGCRVRCINCLEICNGRERTDKDEDRLFHGAGAGRSGNGQAYGIIPLFPVRVDWVLFG